MAAPLRRSRFSALSRRIILFNAFALVVLIAGVLTVQSQRASLVDERLSGIQQQAQIVASTLAEYTTDEDNHMVFVSQAKPLLRQLIAPTRLRARLYDTNGRLLVDTRYLLARNVVQVQDLPPIDGWDRFKASVARLYDGVMGVRPFTHLDPYFEAGDDGRVYGEVTTALGGDSASAERVDERNKLVLSIAMPIQRFKAIYGVLLVTTEGGDIDDILRDERKTLIQVFLVAVAVMVISSLFLARFIAEPVQRLAQAADEVRSGHAGRGTIPSMEERRDEIGDLAASLAAMTRALYDRIDAIERFAADVAHELKNPLTSLKSAVEMLTRATDDAARTRMMGIVRNDVKRIDRLITDISDASRLDAELSRETSERVDLAHLLETIVEVYRFTEISKGVNVELAIELPAQARVLGRDERLGQVFRNLIDNAVSFSKEGATVTVAARAEGGNARVTVEDDGPGIPPDNLETIFERFYTERPNANFGNNSGLGLSIARQIAESAGGSITAENREAGGARFIVVLPLAR
ncbi:MAG TPA: stimulus-sensing domain-containing protein [Rhizomicrobium sp.]|jgi:two-component system sensor histidine kinase ChvG|nr:stimulus-sensing domain-containing protein [Rhizomicrobium sp.]